MYGRNCVLIKSYLLGLLVVVGIGGSVLSCSGLGVHTIDGVCVCVSGGDRFLEPTCSNYWSKIPR